MPGDAGLLSLDRKGCLGRKRLRNTTILCIVDFRKFCLMINSTENVKWKFLKWKEAFENKGLKVNF